MVQYVSPDDLYHSEHDRQLQLAGFNEDDPNTYHVWTRYWRDQGYNNYERYRVT